MKTIEASPFSVETFNPFWDLSCPNDNTKLVGAAALSIPFGIYHDFIDYKEWVGEDEFFQSLLGFITNTQVSYNMLIGFTFQSLLGFIEKWRNKFPMNVKYSFNPFWDLSLNDIANDLFNALKNFQSLLGFITFINSGRLKVLII